MRILVIAPHNDDEVLGVGGTIAKYSSSGHEIFVCSVTRGKSPERAELIRKEAIEAHNILGVKDTVFLDLPAVQLRETPLKQINHKFSQVIEEVKPDLVFIPHKGDMHMDHTVVAHSAMVALRPINNIVIRAIYSYETLSETEWNMPRAEYAFMPNVWNDVTDFMDKKMAAMSCYRSQIKDPPHPRSNEIIEALARLRGSTIGVPYAEAFMLIRQRL